MYNEVTSTQVSQNALSLDLLENINEVINDLEKKINPILLGLELKELEPTPVREKSQVVGRIENVLDRLIELKNRVNI